MKKVLLIIMLMLSINGFAALNGDVKKMGDEKAPVTVYVFSSLTCGHCSGYHTDVLPKIDAKYVKSGQVKLVYVDFPFDNRAMAGAVLARCVKSENYWDFLHTLFENQRDWAYARNAGELVEGYAAAQGLNKADIKACLANQGLKQSLASNRDLYMKKYNITGTPTTVVEKGKITQTIVGKDFDAIDKVIGGLLQ